MKKTIFLLVGLVLALPGFAGIVYASATVSTSPVLSVSASCTTTNIPQINLSWPVAGESDSNYNIDVTSNPNFNTGGWYLNVEVGTSPANYTLSNFNKFAVFGPTPGSLSFTAGQTYLIKIRLQFTESGQLCCFSNHTKLSKDIHGKYNTYSNRVGLNIGTRTRCFCCVHGCAGPAG